MGNNDDCVVKFNQEILQPADRFQIQMVRRLIEKQNVRITKQCLRKQDLYLLIGRKLAHHHRMCLGRNAKTIQKRSSIRLSLPAVHICKLFLKLCGTDTVLVREIRLCVDGILLLHDLIQTLISHNNRIQNRIRIILEVILLQERKTLPRCDNDITLRRFDLTV